MRINESGEGQERTSSGGVVPRVINTCQELPSSSSDLRSLKEQDQKVDSPGQGVVRGQESPAPGARLPSSGEIRVVLLSEVQSVRAQQ